MIKILSALTLGAVLLLGACKSDEFRVGYKPSTDYPYASSLRVDIGTDGTCSAVHIGEGYILSAAHCFNGGTQRKIEGKGFELLWVNKRYDIAFINAPMLKDEPASPLVCRDPIVGEDITIVGEPLGLENIHTFGRVAGIKRFLAHWSDVAVLNVVVAPGNSGSPVYDSNYNVIGILVGGYNVPFTGVGMAVPGTSICKLMGK